VIGAVNRVLPWLFIAIGVVALAETAYLGGGQVGVLVGIVFIALGWLRLRAMRHLR
jgi:hypothetical protein